MARYALIRCWKTHSETDTKMTKKAIMLLAAVPALHAGTPETAPTVPPAAPEPWIKPLIDIRARYEYADIDGLNESNAFTVRERLGLQTMSWHGFSALVEGEFSQAAGDNYHGGAAGANPFDPTRAAIADPESNELNQAFLHYSGYDMVAKFGRQRIIYDNSAFIGNVGWRQNEQTYDAISISGSWIDSLTVNYAYIDRVNRIFGSDAAGNAGSLSSEVHALNLSYTGTEGIKLGAYAYIMEFPSLPGWDNSTFGVSAAGKLHGLDLYGEVAWQDDAGATRNGEALYFHATATKPLFGNQSLTVGVESLGAGFKTPLATNHAFNGFADAFLGGRTGGTHNGLTDTYVSHSLPIFWGMKWTNTLHAFGDDEVSAGYGWEYDSVLVKKFDENFSALAKFAYFDGGGDPFVGAGALADTTRFSIELDYKF